MYSSQYYANVLRYTWVVTIKY